MEWKLLGAVGYGLPLASGVLIGMMSAGMEADLKLGLFLWLAGMLLVGMAWASLGWETKQKGYFFVGLIGLLTFFSTAYSLSNTSNLVSEFSTLSLRPPPASMLWSLSLSAGLMVIYTMLEIVAMAHAGGTYGERFLRWSAWSRALALGLMALGLLSFLPLLGEVLQAFPSGFSPTSILAPFLALGVGGIAYMASTVFAMIGFLDLKVNKSGEGAVGR